MGFSPQPTIYNINFDEDSVLYGLEFRASACTVRQYREMLRRSAEIGSDEEEPTDDEAKLRFQKARLLGLLQSDDWMLSLFADHLISWNYEDPIDGQPITPNFEGLLNLEKGHLAEIIAAWQTAIVSVPKISRSSSDSGAISQEQSLGLGDVSENL